MRGECELGCCATSLLCSRVGTWILGRWIGAAIRIQAIPRPILLVTTLCSCATPNGEVWVGVGLNVLVDVRLGGEIVRVASDVGLSLWLVDTDVVNEHLAWEAEVVPIDESESGGDGQVDEDIHGFLRYGSAADSDPRIGCKCARTKRPGTLTVRDPVNVAVVACFVLEAVHRKVTTAVLIGRLKRVDDTTGRLLEHVSLVRVELCRWLEELVLGACSVDQLVAKVGGHPLTRLRDTTDSVADLCLDDIDLGCSSTDKVAARVLGARVILAGACAG